MEVMSMEYWNQPAEDVREEFGTGPDGLQDARVRKIRETSGENVLAEGKKKSILMRRFVHLAGC